MIKKALFLVLFFSISLVNAQFNGDLVTKLHSGTDADMGTMNTASDKAQLFYNTTHDKVYYHNGVGWVIFEGDNQDIVGSGLSGDTLTIGIEAGVSETVDLSSLKDNLGNHIATTNINLNGNYLSGDGDNEGVFVDNDGQVGIGTATPDINLGLEVIGKAQNQNTRTQITSDSLDETTNLSNWTDVPGLTRTITTADADILVLVTIPAIINTQAYCAVSFRIVVDGVQQGSYVEHETHITATNTASIFFSANLHALAAVSAGNHTITVQWATVCGTAIINDNPNSVEEGPRALSVIEL